MRTTTTTKTKTKTKTKKKKKKEKEIMILTGLPFGPDPGLPAEPVLSPPST